MIHSGPTQLKSSYVILLWTYSSTYVIHKAITKLILQDKTNKSAELGYTIKKINLTHLNKIVILVEPIIFQTEILSIT